MGQSVTRLGEMQRWPEIQSLQICSGKVKAIGTGRGWGSQTNLRGTCCLMGLTNVFINGVKLSMPIFKKIQTHSFLEMYCLGYSMLHRCVVGCETLMNVRLEGIFLSPA